MQADQMEDENMKDYSQHIIIKGSGFDDELNQLIKKLTRKNLRDVYHANQSFKNLNQE